MAPALRPPALPGQPTAASAPTASLVLALQSLISYPSVSLLLTTTPGARLDPADAARLERLAAQARQRVTAEGRGDTTAVLSRLDELVRDAQHAPARRALALFANGVRGQRVDLDIEVADRCVVDPTFATRDLVRALHRTPRHVVLLVSAVEARLLDGSGATLSAAQTSSFPMSAEHPPGRPSPARVAAFLRRVDQALEAYLRVRPAPLVLAGAEPTVSQFAASSRNTARLAGVVKGSHTTTPVPELTARIRPVIETYLRSRQQEALDLLEQRDGEHRVAHGIDAAWLASRWQRPEMLAVEEGFSLPVRVSADGDTLTPAEDVDHPDVIDDAVDELIETVLTRGGWVALVEDGALPGGARVALTLRR